jgi:hypothetical protein
VWHVLPDAQPVRVTQSAQFASRDSSCPDSLAWLVTPNAEHALLPNPPVALPVSLPKCWYRAVVLLAHRHVELAKHQI